MGLFQIITCDVLPEVYQYLITQVFLLESITFIWKAGTADIYFDFHPVQFMHLRMIAW